MNGRLWLCFGIVFSGCVDIGDQGVDNLSQAASSNANAEQFGPEVPLAYFELSLEFTKTTAGFTPPVQSRAFGYMGLALYEALVKGMPENRSLAKQLNGVGSLPKARHKKYHWPSVANAALAEVMRGLWGDVTNQAANNTTRINNLEASFEAEFSNVRDSLRRDSVLFGRSVGAAVFATSLDDGGHRSYQTNFPADYVPPTGNGLWVPTAPGQRALQPYWSQNITTFALADASQCGPDGPPAYSETPGSDFYNEGYQVYQAVNNVTADQLTVARFWADGPGTFSGPGHSLAIANQIIVQEGATLAQAAETYALVGIANADAVSSCWWAKYHYNTIRPITYVRAAIDVNWATPLPTPPFPEYTSAHSVQSAAAASMLEKLYGDNVAFVDHAHDVDGFAPRPFNTIFSAAEEAAVSRLYGGIHFASGIYEGLDQGRCVADIVHDLEFREDDDDDDDN